VNVDFAPVADVTGGPSNTVIGSRSYGSAPSPVARQLAAAVRGYESAGVAATLKHFPGHGHTAIDSHRALPVLRQDKATLTREDLAPFAAGIQAGASIVMTGHLRVLAVDRSEPATFSKPLVTGVLRGELGFTGVVITDAMNMAAVAGRYPPGEAAVRAVLAGSDVVMMPPDVRAARDGLLAAIRSGRLPRAQARASAGRILALKAKLAGADQPAVSTLRSAQHTAVAGRAAREAITVLRGPCAGPLVRGPVRVAGGTAAQRRTLAAALAADGVPSGRGPVVRLTGYGDGPKDLRPAAATIALDTPYVLASAHSPVLLAAYSSVPDSLRAVAAVLAGKARATGRLPVTVPHTAKCGNSAGP
jgi:beta-N-acetylhexosaminidase